MESNLDLGLNLVDLDLDLADLDLDPDLGLPKIFV